MLLRTYFIDTKLKSVNILIKMGLCFRRSVLISFLHPTFMKIGKFEILFYVIFYFDDLHLQIIEGISPKASAENSSAQWDIFLFVNWRSHVSIYFLPFLLKYLVKSNTFKILPNVGTHYIFIGGH